MSQVRLASIFIIGFQEQGEQEKMHGKEERVNKRNAVYLSGTSDFCSGLWQALLPGNILFRA